MKKKKLPQYAFGSYVENPYTALTENDIAKAKAVSQANNGLTKVLDIVGPLMTQVGTSMMQQGMSQGQGISKGADGIAAGAEGDTGDGFNWGKILSSIVGAASGAASSAGQTYATGGKAINVEGGEVVETPNGVPMEMVGPSHAQGGIDITIPSGTTEIFSKRVKGPDGKTMAQRKKNREKQIAKLQKELERDPTNKILQKTLEKTLVNNELQEQEDLKVMQDIRDKKQKGNKKYADGGLYNPAYDPSLWDWAQVVPNPNLGYMENTSNFGSKFGTSIPSDFYNLAQDISGANNYNLDFSNKDSIKGFQSLLGAEQDGIIGADTYSRMQKYAIPLNSTPVGYNLNVNTTPGTVNTNTTLANFMPTSSSNGEGAGTKAGIDWNNLLGNGLTFGDAIGMAGNIYSMTAPMKNTLKNRAGDTPNINAFKDYGKEGLQVLDKSKQYVNQVRDQQLKSLETSRAGAINRGRNSARGINTLRAMDLATDMGANQQKNVIFQQFAQAMMGILGQEAQMENQQDAMVMQGEQARDLADRQDRDNFYSQMAQNIANMGTGLQKTGRDINQIKTRNVTENVYNQLYDQFGINSMTGNIKVKATKTLKENSSEISQFPSSIRKKAHSNIMNGLWVVNKNTGEVIEKSTGRVIDFNTGNPIN